jgi:drug/metabolite transporter (DMT)-like permease
MSLHAWGRMMPPREFGLVLLLGILWGSPYALTKISLETIPPLTLVTARVCIAAAVLWLVTILLRRRIPATWSFSSRILAQGALSCVAPYTLLAFGQQAVDSGLAAVLNSTAPLFVCLISFIWTRDEKLTPRKVLGVISGFVGVVGVAGTTALSGLGQQSLSQAVIVLAAASSAMSAIHGKRFASVAPEVVAAGTLTSAAIILLPFCLFFEEPWRLSPSGASAAALMANAVVATALGFVVYFKLLRAIGSVGTASASYLKPAVGVLIGVWLLGEPLTWPFIVALVAILGGIAAINSGRRNSPNEAGPGKGELAVPTPS